MGPLLRDALYDLVRTVFAKSGAQLAVVLATMALLLVSLGFIVLAGFVLVVPLIGIPVTALAFGALFSALAIAVHAWGQRFIRRQAEKAAASRARAVDDIVLAAGALRLAGLLLPAAAFLAAFVLARRP